jgi:hypothetical protein
LFQVLKLEEKKLRIEIEISKARLAAAKKYENP